MFNTHKINKKGSTEISKSTYNSVKKKLTKGKKSSTVKFYKNTFVILIALIVTVSLKWVGMLIINSLLVLPAASARNVTKNMKTYHITSVTFSLFAGISGLIISYYIGTSAGATIVLISSLIFFVTFFINRSYNLD